eukprot:COSAG02_NODE_1681_length_11351_cov_20.077320_5_plen_119_part_00
MPVLQAVRGREIPVAPGREILEAPVPMAGGLAQLPRTTSTSTSLVVQEVGRTTHLHHQQLRTKIETPGGTRQIADLMRTSVRMEGLTFKLKELLSSTFDLPGKHAPPPFATDSSGTHT